MIFRTEPCTDEVNLFFNVTFTKGSSKLSFESVEYEPEFSKLESKVKSHFLRFMFLECWCRIRLKIVADIPILEKITSFMNGIAYFIVIPLLSFMKTAQ